MKTALYPRLAWDGLRKNKRLFTPYLLTCVCMVMMFYILSFLGSPETCALLPRGSNSTGLILNLGSFVIFVFSAIFLYYTNSFLVRRREREFGLYNVLGMNKRNLARIVTWESLITAVLSLVLGLALSMWLLHIGQPDYIAAAGAIAGVTAGTILSLVYMAIDYLRHRPALRRGESCASDRAILRRLLALAIPITLSSSMVSLITLIDTKLVQGRLQDALGYTLDQMRAAYGNYSACMDLYNLPSSLMVALTASVIPAVSAAVTQRDRRQSARIVRSSLRVTALLAFPMGLGLWALSDPLFRLFYRSYNAELGGSLLAVLGIASIFVCLMLITNSILQAYGRVSVPIVTMLVGGGVKIVLNYNLVALPSVNIHGAPIGTLVCFALTALLNLIAVARIAPFRLNYPGYFLRPLFASLVMAFAARGVYALAAHFLIPSVEEASRLTLLLCVGIAIGVAVVIYGVLVLALHCIRRSDLELLPKGDKLARLLHIS